VAAVQAFPAEALVTTWACTTETLNLLNRVGGFAAQERLFSLLISGQLTVHVPGEREWERIFELMRQYADAPMDFADASLVVLAELLKTRRIFTLDEHFYFYRINGRDAFDVVP
jgi:predicted nucleic acid-binding protein